MKRVIVALAVFIACPASAHGQFASAVAEGVRVRASVTDAMRQQSMAPKQALIYGTVARTSNDSLYLQLPNTTGTVAIDRLQIKRLAVSRGMQSPVESAIVKGIGSAIGFAATSWIRWQLTPREDRGRNSAAEAAATSAAYGFGVGAIIGVIWPTEKWKRVRLGT